ncbi:hypothetical protein [Jatrophihabitans fulvus]
MRRPTRVAGTAALLLTTAVVLSACSSDGDGGAPPSSAPSVASSAPSSAPSSGTAASSESSSGASSGASSGSAALEPALLPASDFGSDYRREVGDTGDRDPLPCTPNDPPLVQQVPPQQYLNGTYVRTDRAIQVTENVFVFADDSAAERYVAAAQKGLGCGSGRIGNESFKISAGTRFSTGTDSDDAIGWDLATSGFKGTLALVRLDEKIVAFTFIATNAAANELQPRPIVEKGVARVDAAL